VDIIIVAIVAIVALILAFKSQKVEIIVTRQAKQTEVQKTTIKPGVEHLTPERESEFAKTRKKSEGNY